MKIRITLCLTAALLVGALVPSFGQVSKVEELKYPPLPEFKIPVPTRLVLDNGVILMVLEDHELPLINASVLVRTGSRLEPAGKVGLAGLAGTVMRTGGTKTMPGDQLDDYLENRAARVETSIGTSSGGASMSCLKKDFPDVLRVLADVLRNPVFEETKLAVAKNRLMAAIARQNDDPGDILSREFTEIVYGNDSPYARSETYASVSAVTREDLVEWHSRYYHPSAMILGLVGDFKTDEAVALVKQVFGDWPKGNVIPASTKVPEPSSVASGVYYVEKNDVNQSSIAMGHLGIRKDNPDYYAVRVLNELFGGSMGSRLFSNVRTKKGLAYDVGGGIGSEWDYAGVFEVAMTTKTETTAAAIKALQEEAKNLTAQPPTEAEVAKAKASILNSFIFNSDSIAEILSQQMVFEYYGYPLDWLSRYRAGIEKVTVEQVRAAAAKYITPDRVAILVVGPKEGMDQPLSTFGKVTNVDITIPEPAAGSGG